MTIAVTGASGFVGTHVLRELAGRGEDVVAVSRGPLREPVPAGVRHIALDLAEADAGTWAALGRPRQLIHLAWGGLPNYLSRHHFEIELPLHYRFLRLMVEGGLPAMLVTGTCYEYGMRDGLLVETMEPAPDNPYAYAKVALWRQLGWLQAEHGFAVTWARLFYMWGEGQATKSLWPLLQVAIANGDRTFPMSAGEQLRDYLPIETVARVIADLARRAQDDGIVNICSGAPISIRTLVERWIDEAGAGIVPELGRYPYPSYEPMAFWGSHDKLHGLLLDLAQDTVA